MSQENILTTIQAIDEFLATTSGTYGPTYWLATDKYSDAPQKKGHGTEPPISKDFTSPWVGCTIEEIVRWLEAKPDDAGFNPRFFAVLDVGTKDDPPTAVVCRTGDLEGKGDKVFSFRFERSRAIEHLMGAPSDAWDELTRNGHGDAEIRYGDDA